MEQVVGQHLQIPMVVETQIFIFKMVFHMYHLVVPHLEEQPEYHLIWVTIAWTFDLTSTGGRTVFYIEGLEIGRQNINAAKAVGCLLRNDLWLFNEMYESSGTSGGTTGDRYTGDFYAKNIQIWKKTISRGELIKWGFANYAHYHRDSSGAENKTINTSIENHEKRIVQLENQVAELININKELMEMIKK